MTKKEPQMCVDGQCALGISGPGAGNCKDPDCGKRVSVLISGYCQKCAQKRGIPVITVDPKSNDKNKQPKRKG